MKKKEVLILCNILIMLFLFGCSNKQIMESDLNSKSVSNEKVVSSSSITQIDAVPSSSVGQSGDSVVSNEIEEFSQGTLDFLEGVYSNGVIPQTIYEVNVPVERLDNPQVAYQYTLQKEQSLVEEFGTDLDYYKNSEKISLLDIDSDTVVSVNNVATMLYSVPYRDSAMNGSFDISHAEAQLNVNITSARDTGIKVSPEFDNTRMYSVLKCDAGGYVYVFFDDILDDNTGGKLKSIIYIDKIYSYDEVSFIKEGISIKKVFNFSPTLKYCYENQTSKLKDIIIPLTDGVMVLVADLSDAQSILSVDYYPDSIVPNPKAYAQSDGRAYNFTILPQDYPPAS